MIAVQVQAVEERMDNVQNNILKEFPQANVYIDKERSGVFNAFAAIMRKNYIGDSQYLLHLQDDIILANGLGNYLPALEEMMNRYKMDLLTLFAPPRKAVVFESKMNPRPFIKIENFLWGPSYIISAKLYGYLVENIEADQEKKHDDVYVASILKTYKIQAYCHNPGLVQHRIDLKSTLGHAASIKRTSPNFDQNWITNQNK